MKHKISNYSLHLLNILINNLMTAGEETRQIEEFHSLVSSVDAGTSSHEVIITLNDGRKLSVSVNQIQ